MRKTAVKYTTEIQGDLVRMDDGELKLRPVLVQNRPVSELRQINTDSSEPNEIELNLNLDKNVKASRAELYQTQNPNEEGNTNDLNKTRGAEPNPGKRLHKRK